MHACSAPELLRLHGDAQTLGLTIAGDAAVQSRKRLRLGPIASNPAYLAEGGAKLDAQLAWWRFALRRLAPLDRLGVRTVARCRRAKRHHADCASSLAPPSAR